MKRPRLNHRMRVPAGIAMRTGMAMLLAWGAMGLSCDQDAETIFRHTVTVPIGAGVKTFLAGDTTGGVGQIVSATIDGLVASIDQAGKPQTTK